METAVQAGTLALLPSASTAIRGGKEPRPWMAIKTREGEILAHTFARDEERAWAALTVSHELRETCRRGGDAAVEVMLVNRADWIETRALLHRCGEKLADCATLLIEAARIELSLCAVQGAMERLTKAVPGFAHLTDRRALEAAIERVDRIGPVPAPGLRS